MQPHPRLTFPLFYLLAFFPQAFLPIFCSSMSVFLPFLGLVNF